MEVVEIVSQRDERSHSEGFLEFWRDQIALFQEGRGVPRGNYSFVTLMAAVTTMVCRSVHSLIMLILTLAPIAEITLHVLRFTLETLVELKHIKDYTTVAKRSLIFAAQLALTMSCLMFTFGSILYPVFCIGANVGMRAMSLVTGRRIF